MQMIEKEALDLTIVMPCLNEEATIGLCITEAQEFIDTHKLKGEILVVDNGSCDTSGVIARAYGVRVLYEEKRGYGNALRIGISHSRGSVIIMGDCDTTYDFKHLEEIYEKLSAHTCDMVIGNRYAGGMEEGSMPWTHRWGVRFLSLCGRIRFQTDVYDFHCGLRGITREAAEKCAFSSVGMEFATEMIAEGTRKGLCIEQVPVMLRKCNYDRSSKLRTIQDGLRHLKYIFITGGK